MFRTQRIIIRAVLAGAILGALPIALTTFSQAPQGSTPATRDDRKPIYHSGWIDLNKNGRMDVYENPKVDIEKRITDLLSQMTLAEKTCQTATLYGYNRVLKDELPTADWKNQVWKDGIANIDEHLNGWGTGSKSIYATDIEKHVWAMNETQRFF